MRAPLALALALALTLAAAGAAAQTIVGGTAAYRERIATPPGAVFEAWVEDVSRADAPSVTLGTARIEDAGNPPWRFEIALDPAAAAAPARLAVRATLTVDGRLWFTTDTHVPVLTDGAPSRVELTLVRVAETPAPTLVGPTWRLVALGDAAAPADTTAHLVFDADDRVSGSGGCNRLAGSAVARDDGAFLAGRLASTMMACPEPAMATEQALHAALAAARAWKIDGRRLTLYAPDGVAVAAFEPG